MANGYAFLLYRPLSIPFPMKFVLGIAIHTDILRAFAAKSDHAFLSFSRQGARLSACTHEIFRISASLESHHSQALCGTPSFAETGHARL